MDNTYTRLAQNQLLSLLEQDSASIWNTIQARPEGDAAQCWRETLAKIGAEYALSGRFALMRILAAREAGVSVTRLPRLPSDIAQAARLTPAENLRYLEQLQEICARETDYNQEQCEYLIARAWYDAQSTGQRKQSSPTRLSRQEALELGHCLRLSLEEMEWFLLRVLDCGETFRFNESNDLIDAYGFLAGASVCRVETLRSRYVQTAAGRVRPAEFVGGRTQALSEQLPQLVKRWQDAPDAMDERFLEWMLEMSPQLDHPSRTALRTYRNLAAFACDLLTGRELVPEEEEFDDCIQDVYEEPTESGAARRLLCENGVPSPEKCRSLAGQLLLENKIQSASGETDNANAWHVLTARGSGKLTVSGGINASRTRVADILIGSVQPEKGDFLYLLWFIENLIWQSADPADVPGIRSRILGFIQTADYLLETALLPRFYVPHPMEQAMLLSIVQGSKIGEDPAVVYEYALSSLKERRERTSGSVRHNLESKIQIVTDYLRHPDMTLDQCAAKYRISPKTLSAWQKTLLEKGLVSR